MPKSRKNTHHLNSGEWSPKVYNRVDHEKHDSALTLCRNAIPEVQGIVSKRTGLGLVAPAKFDDTTCRLIDFQFSREDYAIIEVGEEYMRFFVSGDQIFAAESVVTQVELTAGGDTIFTSVANSIGNGKEVYLSAFGSKAEFSNRWGFLETVTANTFKVTNRDGSYVQLKSGTAVGTYSATGSVFSIYEIASPYLASEVSAIRYVQKNDVIWLVHANHAPRQLIRLANDNWTLTEIGFQYPATEDPNVDPAITLKVDNSLGKMTAVGFIFSTSDIGAYYAVRHIRPAQEQESPNYSPSSIDVLGRWTMETSGKWSGTVEVQKQKFEGAVLDADFINVGSYTSDDGTGGEGKNFNVTGTQEDVTRKYRLRGDGIVLAKASIRSETVVIDGVVKVTSIDSPSIASVDVIQDAAITNEATDDWSRGAWRGDNGYPSVIAFYESRLWMGSTPSFSNELWATEADLFDSFKVGDEDTDGLHIQLNSRELNDILWLEDLKKLSIGTTGGEWSLSGTDLNRIISPTNIIAQKVDNNGSRAIDSARGGNSVFHVKSGGKMILEYKYDLGADDYRGTDVTLFSSHLMQPKIKKLAFSSNPFEILWALGDDGDLTSMTRDVDQKVYAWAKHETAGIIDDVTTIEGADGNTQLWATVKRVIGGEDRYFVEQMTGVTDYPNSQLIGGASSGVPAEGIVEVMLLIDTTGSMGSITTQIQNDIEAFVAGLDAEYGSRLRVGVIGFKDEDDNPVFDPIVPMSNWSAALAAVDALTVSGGGYDLHENGFGAIVYAGESGGWSTNSHRIVSLWTDDESHSRGATLAEAATALNDLGADFYYNFSGIHDPSNDNWAYGNLAAEVDGATGIVTDLDGLLGEITSSVEIELGGARSERFTDCSVDCTVFGEFAYGLAHLEGETVWADADGFAIFGIVTEGRLSLNGSFASVKAGLQYTADIETLQIDADASSGDITGYTKVMSRAYVDLVATNNLKWFDGSRFRTKTFRSANNDQTLPPEVVDSQVELDFQTGHTKRFTIALRSDDPLPFTIAGLVLHYDVTGE